MSRSISFSRPSWAQFPFFRLSPNNLRRLVTNLAFLAQEERKSDIGGTVRTLDANFMILTPSVAQILSPDDVPSLKTLVIGGEAANQHLIDTWSERVELLSGYGPTEAAIVAAVGRLTSDTEVGFLGTPVNVLSHG